MRTLRLLYAGIVMSLAAISLRPAPEPALAAPEPVAAEAAPCRICQACQESLAKVDAEAGPGVTCAAPQPLAARPTDGLTLDGTGPVSQKRVSVSAMVRQALADQKKLLEVKEAEVVEWGPATRARFTKWFGTTGEAERGVVLERIRILLKINARYSLTNFRRSERPTAGIFAYVRPTDPTKVFLDEAFVTAPPVGANSRAGTITHEMSHFRIAGGTKDHAYGQAKCQDLARTKPDLALTNADNFEFFIENAR